jgi:hypothetical protein
MRRKFDYTEDLSGENVCGNSHPVWNLSEKYLLWPDSWRNSEGSDW